MVIRALGIFAVVAVALVLASRGSDSPSPRSRTALTVVDARVPQPRCPNVVWSADQETGDLSQWYIGEGGGEVNSGAAESSASEEVAHGGRYSAKLTIATPHVPVTSGVRLFRWNESQSNVEACYSAWYYFPQRHVVAEWWNIFAFKSKSGDALNDAFWQLQIGNRPGGAMFVYLTWWGPPLEGPRPGLSGLRHFTQSLKDVPVGEWTHLEVYLRQSGGFDGQIVVWQDGVELFDMNNVRTRYGAENGANEWMLANYSDSIVPSPTTIYIDDAVVSTAPARPLPGAAVPPEDR